MQQIKQIISETEALTLKSENLTNVRSLTNLDNVRDAK